MKVCLVSAAALVIFGSATAFAQEAQSPPANAAPAGETLPEVKVVTEPEQKPKPAAKKKTVNAAPPPAPVVAQAPPAQEPVTEPETPGQKFDADLRNATGHSDGYIAPGTATATKTATPIAETPQSISVVTADRMRDQGVRTVESALRYVPGVYAEPYGFDSRGDYTMIRGTEPTKFLDGLKRSLYYWDVGKPDPYELERIEVLRGPASMLYGQHTSGGLLNMVSKRPEAETHGEVGVEFGSYDRRGVFTDNTGKLTDDGKWLYRFVGIGYEGDTQMDSTDNSRLLFAPSLTYKPQAGTSITLLGHAQKDKASGSTLGFFPIEGTLVAGPNGRVSTKTNPSNPDFDKYDTDNQAITALIDHQITDDWSVHHGTRYMAFNLSYKGAYADIYSNPGNFFLDPQRRTVNRFQFASEVDGNILTTDTNTQLKFATGMLKHRVLAGFDYTRLEINEDSGDYLDTTPFDIYNPVYPTTPTPLPDLSLYATNTAQYAHGFYVQDQMRLGPLTAIAGVRYDEVRDTAVGSESQESSAITQRYALMYETPFGLNPYITYGESFTPVAGQNPGEPFFKPVVGELKEIGFKYQPAPKTLISAAIYQLDEQNRLTSDPTDPNRQTQLGQTRVEGWEIEAITGITENIDVIASYSYNDARIKTGDGAGNHIEAVPEQLASLWAVYKFLDGPLNGFSLGGGIRYIGETGDSYYKAPSYTLFDAMIAYDAKTWRWQLNGSNLEDEVYIGSCGSRGDCFYGQRLNITTSLTYRY